MILSTKGAAAAASGSTARRFRNDRPIMRSAFNQKQTESGNLFRTNLSDLEFVELVWFAAEASFEWSRRCRGKTKRRGLSNC
jgi:hypothetical protein